MQRLVIFSLVVPMLLAGCDRPGGSSSTASNPSAGSLLQPYQGVWRFDLQKTLTLWGAQGVPATQIAQAQALHQAFRLHPDMTIAGQTGTLAGSPEGEYAFFALHPHSGWVCGKAWHHEDRHDPGDMSKCYVRLKLEDAAELHLAVRREDGMPGGNDPDLIDPLPPTAPANTCAADAAPNPPWSPWTTYVFVRP